MDQQDIFDFLRGNYGLSNKVAAQIAIDLAEQMHKCPECGTEYVPEDENQSACSEVPTSFNL
jgi:hypothetical protein